MKKIKRIVIRGESGYGSSDDAFSDKVTLNEDSIKYEYIPMIPSEFNMSKKWSYRTNNPLFKKYFDEICKMLPSALDLNPEMYCTDIGAIKFTITYEDNTKESKVFIIGSDEFADLFRPIKRLVPDFEEIPVTLMTEEDYEED